MREKERNKARFRLLHMLLIMFTGKTTHNSITGICNLKHESK